MKSQFFFFILLLSSISCKKKDSDTPTEYSVEDALTRLTLLEDGLNESSGLLFVAETLYTHNDSGDDPQFYSISESSPEINERIKIDNAIHRDWEDMAQDETHIYFGDFGNNRGDRQDLTIYKFPKSVLPNDADAEFIRFTFSDQINFDHTNNIHNFDCEAMIVVDENIYLFSKNHADQQTKLYKLPSNPGTYTAELLTTFDTDGLITAAGIDKNTNTLCLLGYNISGVHFNPFVWIFYDFEGTAFFDKKMKRVNLSIQSQTEGICFKSNGQFIISSEDENGEEGELYLFDVNKWIN